MIELDNIDYKLFYASTENPMAVSG